MPDSAHGGPETRTCEEMQEACDHKFGLDKHADGSLEAVCLKCTFVKPNWPAPTPTEGEPATEAEMIEGLDFRTKQDRAKNVAERLRANMDRGCVGYELVYEDGSSILTYSNSESRGEWEFRPLVYQVPAPPVARNAETEDWMDVVPLKMRMLLLDWLRANFTERERDTVFARLRSTPEADERERDLFLAIMLAVEADVAKGRARWEIADELKSVIRRTKKLVKDIAATPPETGDEP